LRVEDLDDIERRFTAASGDELRKVVLRAADDELDLAAHRLDLRREVLGEIVAPGPAEGCHPQRHPFERLCLSVRSRCPQTDRQRDDRTGE
jgi:hypothetical protein